MALSRILSMVLALFCSIRASCNVDTCVRDGTCEDLTGLLQSKVQVDNVMTEGIEEEEEEEEDVGEADTEEMEIEEGVGEADITEMEMDEETEGMAAVEPPPITVVEEAETSNTPLGSSSVCGVGEEIISTNCLGNSPVKEQAIATARMMMGGCCTAWLVKAETANQGALMLSTGHCGKKATARFDFNYVGACPGKAPASQMKSCNGKRLSVEAAKDEQAIYELDKGCKPANAAKPILLDIGRPDPDEGMYILGHPNCRPSLLSHQEAHDDGHHCEVRSIANWGASTRVSYYCDTQGGNSGSPVFSARTGYAFAIHSHGGCSKGQSSKNWGGLLENSGVVAAFKKYGIPFVNRKDTNLFKYENFVHEPKCLDHAQNAELKQKSLAECKKLCVGSLTCVGIEYSASQQSCSVNYRSKKTPSSCQGDAKYYRRTDTLTSTLENAPLPTTPAPPPPAAPGTCGFENMQSADCKVWSNTANGDNFDWTRATKTPSSGTGPSKAASGSHFMYIETSHPRKVNDKAIYQSAKVTLGSTASLSFKYHMYGSAIGELKVVVKESGSGSVSTVWNEKGAKGNQWKSATVPLGSFAGKEVSLQFTGIRGSSWAGDIALDDVNLETGGSAPTSQAPATQAPTTQAPTTQAPATQAPTTQAPPTQAPSPPSLDQRVASLDKQMDEILKLVKILVNQR